MAPTVKDVENPTSTSTPTLPSPQAANPAQTSPRPQPVPLEVPVTVNGARTIEGSDKREPFSEATKTVLVFVNGAVIRLASSVAPGQLLFVTNDKTKKEVVCQVVKSKNYRTVTGYVELEFTESSPGFWGVRIPTDSAPSAAAQPKVPVAQRPAVTPVSPASGSPKATAPLPASPAATPANSPVAAPQRPFSAPLPALSAATPKPVVVATPIPHVISAPAKTEVLPAQLAAQLSALVATEPVSASQQPAPHEAAKSSAPQKSSDASTEELRQQAARLQEQLSSLLFREATPAKTAVPHLPPSAASVIAPTQIPPVPKEMLRGADALQQAVAELEASANPEANVESKPEPSPAPKIETSKVFLIPAPVVELKTPPVVSKSSSISLSVEEVKIPSWLAPLARDTETTKEGAPTSPANSSLTEQISSYGNAEELTTSIASEPAQKSLSVVFGGQFLGGSESTEVQAAPTGSSKGLVFGLVAAGLLAAAGVAWYGLQPGNFLASKPPAPPAAQTGSAASIEPASKSDSAATTPSAVPNPASTLSPSVATNNRPVPAAPAVAASAASSHSSNPAPAPDATKLAVTGDRSVPVEEAPKKLMLGDVRLATPNVNRKANSTSSEAAPAIDGVEVSNAGDPLTGLAANHGNAPTAPVPVGGDVKTAHLLKSVPPVYPPAAKSQRISGDVKLDAQIDTAGNVTTTQIISGPILLHQAAMVAVKQWKYQPAQLNGSPTSMHLTVTVQFRLQ